VVWHDSILPSKRWSLQETQGESMAANKEPASIIAAQLRHADGGALAQRVYIHQLPQTASRVAGLIEGVFGQAARDGRAVSAGRRVEGNRSVEPGLIGRSATAFSQLRAVVAGTGFEPV
jgi:hypothetical protein